MVVDAAAGVGGAGVLGEEVEQLAAFEWFEAVEVVGFGVELGVAD